MATINKNETLMNSSFEQDINFDYVMSLGVVIEGLPSNQIDFYNEALTTLALAGYEIGEPAGSPFGVEPGLLEIVNIKITPLSSSSARATIHYAVPLVSATLAGNLNDIKWIWETSSTARAEQQNYQTTSTTVDTPGDAIQVFFQPPDSSDPTGYMDDTVWALEDNVRRFQQTHTATKYRPWQTAVARARIRYDWVNAHEGSGWHPRAFSQKLAGKVNNELNPPNVDNTTRGIWMCQGVQVSTPNNGIIWDVRVIFARDNFGWDPVILYRDPNNHNNIPKEVGDLMGAGGNGAIFKQPYPLTDRILASNANNGKPYGGLRPRMHCLYDFTQIGIDLRDVTE